MPSGFGSLDELRVAVDDYAQSTRYLLLLMCLSDDRRDALQQDLCDRVRRVNPAATENVTGAMLGASFALESGAMIEAIGEDDLVTMLNDVDEVYHLSLRISKVKTAKMLKDVPVGIPKAFVTAAAKEQAKLPRQTSGRRSRSGDGSSGVTCSPRGPPTSVRPSKPSTSSSATRTS